MPLLRLVSHYKDNPHHVDKLIDIDGLPESWMFYFKDGKKFLKKPFDFDITPNIPLDIRMEFQPEPLKVWTEFPGERMPGQTDGAMPKWIVEEHDIYGFRLDYQTGPGKDMWEQIENLLDRETPRDKKVPKPAMVGDRLMWKLTADNVPSVRLNKSQETLAQPTKEETLEPVKVARPDEFACPECGMVFEKQRAQWMHTRFKHKSKDPMKVKVPA